ncbi:YEATS domain-containing protein 4 [Trichoplax sp. H2]|nr:YEATS domain-containing protein 4 [Trichoplax sp. H2]|eukprot:RDD40504.1 YEATS domain-containing protein 4 [Trichoplax sp. H2]
MAELASSDGQSGRVKGATVIKPIIYGNIAQSFGKKREEDNHTHEWTVFVRPYKDEDVSQWVKKVQFKLHDSYTDPVRVLTSAPFEVVETGWGEFEIVIKIFFTDPTEKPVTLYHALKLFATPPVTLTPGKRVFSEHYDEIVFTDPTHFMYSCLMNATPQQSLKHEVDYIAHEKETMTLITNAAKKVEEEIADKKKLIQNHKETKEQYVSEIAKLECEVKS